MNRPTAASISALCLAAGLFAAGLFAAGTCAAADGLPHRRSGVWETTMHRDRQGAAPMKTQQCVDDKTDEAMQRMAVEGNAAMHCERTAFNKVAGGFESNSICKTAQGTITSRMRVVGDMQSTYRVEVSAHRDPPVGDLGDTHSVMEARWLGACPADMKPGDMRVNGMLMHPGAGRAGMDPKAIGAMSPAERMEYMKKLMEARSQQQ